MDSGRRRSGVVHSVLPGRGAETARLGRELSRNTGVRLVRSRRHRPVSSHVSVVCRKTSAENLQEDRRVVQQRLPQEVCECARPSRRQLASSTSPTFFSRRPPTGRRCTPTTSWCRRFTRTATAPLLAGYKTWVFLRMRGSSRLDVGPGCSPSLWLAT